MSDSKSLSQERFSRFAEGYVSSQTHAQGSDLDRLLAIAAPQAEWTVLDVATGGGHTALKFAPHVAQVTASDLTPQMLAKAEAFIREQGVSNVDFAQADAEDLPFDDAQYDLVTCRIAPHHFPDVGRFVQEAARVLKPGGLLLVQDHVLAPDAATGEYAEHIERLRDPSHNHAYSESGWRQLFEQAGLTVAHTEQLTKRHQLQSWAERQGCSPETIAELTRLLNDAPLLAADWLAVENCGTPDLSFVNHHLIIAGRKA